MRSILLLSTLAGSLTVAACSGGGGGGGGGGGTGGGGVPPTKAPASTPTPTPLPTYVLPTAAAAVLSSYTIGSQPESLAVTVDATPDGMTPASAAPAYATKPHVFTIVPTGTASPYVVSLVQTANGSHTIFYNEPIDTTGAISAISATPLARMRQFPSLVGKATGPRRFALSIGPPTTRTA